MAQLSHFETGIRDAAAGRFFAHSLPSAPREESRVGYRVGFTLNRAARGIQDLPALMHETRGRRYWLVAIDRGNPVFNVTNGERPTGGAGYHDLVALMRLKGDTLA